MESDETARRRGLVDIALIGLMRDCMLRRSEAADVRWSHITSESDGTGRLFVGVSKTHQEGEGTLLFVSRQTNRRRGTGSRGVRSLQWTQRPCRHGKGHGASRRRAAGTHDGR